MFDPGVPGRPLFVALPFGRSDLSVFCLILLLLSTGAKLWRRAGAARVSSRFRTETLRASPGEPLVFAVEAENGSILPMTDRSRLDGVDRLSGDILLIVDLMNRELYADERPGADHRRKGLPAWRRLWSPGNWKPRLRVLLSPPDPISVSRA